MKTISVDILTLKKRTSQILELLQTNHSFQNISRAQASGEKVTEITYPHAKIRAEIKMLNAKNIEIVENLLRMEDSELSAVRDN